MRVLRLIACVGLGSAGSGAHCLRAGVAPPPAGHCGSSGVGAGSELSPQAEGCRDLCQGRLELLRAQSIMRWRIWRLAIPGRRWRHKEKLLCPSCVALPIDLAGARLRGAA